MWFNVPTQEGNGNVFTILCPERTHIARIVYLRSGWWHAWFWCLIGAMAFCDSRYTVLGDGYWAASHTDHANNNCLVWYNCQRNPPKIVLSAALYNRLLSWSVMKTTLHHTDCWIEGLYNLGSHINSIRLQYKEKLNKNGLIEHVQCTCLQCWHLPSKKELLSQCYNSTSPWSKLKFEAIFPDLSDWVCGNISEC